MCLSISTFASCRVALTNLILTHCFTSVYFEFCRTPKDASGLLISAKLNRLINKGFFRHLRRAITLFHALFVEFAHFVDILFLVSEDEWVGITLGQIFENSLSCGFSLSHFILAGSNFFWSLNWLTSLNALLNGVDDLLALIALFLLGRRICW